MTLTHIPDLIPYLNSSVEDDRMEVKQLAPFTIAGRNGKEHGKGERKEKPL
jgi:hypothetical protein